MPSCNLFSKFFFLGIKGYPIICQHVIITASLKLLIHFTGIFFFFLYVYKSKDELENRLDLKCDHWRSLLDVFSHCVTADYGSALTVN